MNLFTKKPNNSVAQAAPPPVAGLDTPELQFDGSSLENNPAVNTGALQAEEQISPALLRIEQIKRRRRIFRMVLICSLLLASGTLFALRLQSTPTNSALSSSVNQRYNTQTIPQTQLGSGSLLGSSSAGGSVNVNGQLNVNNALVLTPISQPSSPVTGQLYFDKTTNQLSFYNGNSFDGLAVNTDVVTDIGGNKGSITLGNDLGFVNGKLSYTGAAGVLSLQGQSGNVALSAGNGIAVDGTTISNSGVLSLGGQTGAIQLGSDLILSSGVLANSGIIGVTAGTNITLSNNGNGVVTINAATGGGTVSSPGGTIGTLAIFSGAQTVADSLLSQSGSDITAGGNLVVTGSLSLGSALSVSQGGTGLGSLTANELLFASNANTIDQVGSGNSGDCLVSNGSGSAPSFQACTGAGGVASVNGDNGAVILNNASATDATHITIDNAKADGLTKGIATFNSSQFSDDGNGLVSIKAGGITNTEIASGTIANDRLANNSIGVTAGNGLSGGGNPALGNSTSLSVAYGSSANTAVQGNITLTCPAGSGPNLSGGGDVITLGTGGACSDINITSSPVFGGTLTVQGAGGITVGTSTVAGIIQLGDGSNHYATLDVSAALAADQSYALPTTGGTICVKEAGNCTGGASGAVTASGTHTQDYLSKFDATGEAITNSSIYDNGSGVSIGGSSPAGLFNVGATNQFQIDSSGAVIATALNSGTGLIQGTGGLTVGGTVEFSSLTGSSGQCLTTDGSGTLELITCLTGSGGGSGGVSSLNGLSGSLSINNATSSGSSITINDAKADGTTKGIAAFNGTNFQASGGVINTIQDIDSSASPTFGGLTLGSALTLANGGTGAVNAANARSNLGAAASGNNSDITSLSALSTALPVSEGGTGLQTLTAYELLYADSSSSVNQLASGNSGDCLVSNGSSSAPSFQACTGAGGVSSITASTKQTGDLTFNGVANQISVTNSGSTFTFATPQDLGTASNVSFGTIDAGTLIKTNGTTRIDDSGNLSNIGTIDTTGLITAGNGLTVSSGTLTLNNLTGGSSTCLTLNGSNQVGTSTCATGSGSNPTLQNVYDNSTNPVAITLSTANKGIAIQDASSPVGGDLFSVTDNSGSTKYFAVTVAGASVSGTLSATDLSGDGSAVTNVNAAELSGQSGSYYTNASNINAGTLGDSYLSSNVAKYNDTTANFTGDLQQGGNDVCTTVGNCVGVAGGGVGGSGSANTIAMFTGSGYTVGNSILSQDAGATTVTVSGDLSVSGTVSATSLSGDGSGVTNVNASKLNGQSGSYYTNGSNISAGTVGDSYLSSNVAKYSDTTANFTGTDLQHNGNEVCDSSGNCTGVAGGAIGGSGSANTIALFNGSGYTIGNSIISQDAGATTVTVGGALDVSGTTTGNLVNSTTGYEYNGTAGSTLGTACSGGQVLQNINVQGGIVTSGSCAANGGGVSPTLQNAYDNSTSPATIQLSSTNEGITIEDTVSGLGGPLLTVENNGGSSIYASVSNSVAQFYGGAVQITSGGVEVNSGSFIYGGTSGATKTCSSGQYLQSQVVQGGIITGGSCTAGGVTTVGTYSTTNTAAGGATISGNTITFQSASISAPGMVDTGNQSFAGIKTFTGGATVAATSGTAFQVQTTGGSSTLLTADTSNMRIDIGSIGTPTSQLYVGGQVPVDVSSGGVGTGSYTQSVYVAGNYAYVVDWGSSKFQIFDISNPASPVDMTSGGVATNGYPFSVYVQGHYAYIVDENTDKLQIFDVSNPSSPVDISGGGVSTGNSPYSVYVQGRYAYVADYLSYKLQVFDVSNPASPTDVSGGGVTTGTNPESVYVQGRYAYVTDSGTNKLQVFDISNPASPTSVNGSGTATGSTPFSVYVQGRYAYVADEGGSKLQVFDVSNPASPTDVSGGGVTTGSSPRAVYVQGRYAYVVDGSSSKLQVFDVSNPASPTDVSGGGVTTGSSPNALFVSGRYAYVADYGANKLQVFDLGGEYAQQFQAGGAEIGTLQVDSDANFAGDASVQGGLNIGQSLQVGGNLASAGTITAVSGFQGPSLDTTASSTLTLGGSNASAINIGHGTITTTITGALSQSGGAFTLSSPGTSSLTAGSSLNLSAAGASTFTTTTGNLTLGTSANSGQLILQANGTSGSVSIGDSNTTTITIGNVSNIVKTISIGNGNTSTNATLNLGSQGTVNIGATGSTSYANTTNIDNTSGSGTQLVNIGSSGTAADALTLEAGNTGKLQIGNGATAHTIQIGTGAAVQAITIGSTNSSSSTSIQGGSGGVNVTGLLTANTGLTIASGQNFVNAGSTLNSSKALSLSTSGAIGTAAATVDSYTTLDITATAGSLSFTLPNPTVSTSGRIVYVDNVGATNSFVLGTVTLSVGTSSSFIWNGTAWTSTAVSTGVSLVGTYSTTNTAAGGATISGNTITFQSASISAPGMVDTGNQSFAGIKTFTGGATVAATSGTAFQVQTTGGSSTLLTADTSNMRIDIGSIGTPTSQLYVGGQVPVDLTSGGVGTAANPNSVYVSGRYAYVVDSNANKLQVFDVSNPASPVDVSGGGVATSTDPTSVYVQGRYAYVTDDSSSKLQVFDVSNPSSPVDVTSGGVSTASGPSSVYVQGRYAYVTDNNAGKLQVFDVSNPASPSDVSSGGVTTGTSPESVYVSGRYAYVVNFGADKLQVFNVSNPASPTDVSGGGVSTGTGPQSVYVQGRYAYVVDYTAFKLQVFDVSNPASPTDVSGGGVTTGSSPRAVYVQGRYAYVVDGSGSKLQVFDVSNPASPTDVSGGGTSTSSQPASVYVSGRYAYVVDSFAFKLQVFDLGGSYIQQLQAGGAEVGTLQVDSDASFAGDVSMQGGLNIGQSLQVTANVGITGSLNVGSTIKAGTALQSPSLDNPSGTLTIGATATSIIFGSSGNGITFTAAGGLVASGTAQHVKSIVLTAEYNGAVLDAQSDSSCTSANSGTMTSGYSGNASPRQNYYNWTATSGTAQCYDVVVQVPIPADFASWSGTPSMYVYNSVGTNSTSVYVEAIDTTGTVDVNYGGYLGISSGTGFGSTTLNALTGTYAANGYMTLKIRLSAASSANVRIGNITLNYNSKF